MPSSRLSEKRDWKRLKIECPVTLKISGRGRPSSLVSGQLVDIGMGGAKLQVGKQLPEGARVVFHAQFRDSKQKVTTLRFEGVVQRAEEEPIYEVAVQFKDGGRILPSDGAGFALVTGVSTGRKNGNGRRRES